MSCRGECGTWTCFCCYCSTSPKSRHGDRVQSWVQRYEFPAGICLWWPNCHLLLSLIPSTLCTHHFLSRCNVVAFGSTGQLGAVAMDCDRVVFHGEAPQLPYGAPIVSYSQRHSGQQVLPAQVSSGWPWQLTSFDQLWLLNLLTFLYFL